MNTRIHAASRFVAVVACMLSLNSLWGQATDDIQTWLLEDGTEVLLLEDHRASLVSIEINFPVNRLMRWSIANDADAAFVCQLYDPERRLEQKREKLGVLLSIGMGWSQARIGGSSLASDFSALIGLIREAIRNRKYNKAEVRKWQRDRILNWNASAASPRVALSKSAISLVYPLQGDPRSKLFDKPKLIRINDRKFAAVRDAVLSAPGRNIAVAGAINKAELHDLVSDLLPTINRTRNFVDTTNEPVSFASHTTKVFEMRKLTQVYLALVRDSLPFFHEDYPAYLVVNQILGGTFSSRLYQKLRHEDGDSYSATLRSSYTTSKRPGMLFLQTYTRADNARVAEQKLMAVVDEIHTNGVDDSEVQRALAFLKGRLVFSLETPTQVVNQAATNKVAGLPLNFRELVLKRASVLSVDEINSFVRDFYDPNKFALVKVVPESS